VPDKLTAESAGVLVGRQAACPLVRLCVLLCHFELYGQSRRCFPVSPVTAAGVRPTREGLI